MELIDPLLQESVDLYQLYWLVRVADKCLSWNPRSRYSMNKVTREKIIYSRLYDHIKEILTAYWLFLFMNTGGKSSIRRHQSLWSRGLFSYWIWIVISNNSIAISTLLHLRWEWLLNFITIWFSWWSMMGFFLSFYLCYGTCFISAKTREGSAYSQRNTVFTRSYHEIISRSRPNEQWFHNGLTGIQILHHQKMGAGDSRAVFVWVLRWDKWNNICWMILLIWWYVMWLRRAWINNHCETLRRNPSNDLIKIPFTFHT